MRISDWSSDVCSSDLQQGFEAGQQAGSTVLFRSVRRSLVVGHDGASILVGVLTLVLIVIWIGDAQRCKGFHLQRLHRGGGRIVDMRSEESRVGKECVSR